MTTAERRRTFPRICGKNNRSYFILFVCLFVVVVDGDVVVVFVVALRRRVLVVFKLPP